MKFIMHSGGSVLHSKSGRLMAAGVPIPQTSHVSPSYLVLEHIITSLFLISINMFNKYKVNPKFRNLKQNILDISTVNSVR